MNYFIILHLHALNLIRTARGCLLFGQDPPGLCLINTASYFYYSFDMAVVYFTFLNGFLNWPNSQHSLLLFTYNAQVKGRMNCLTPMTGIWTMGTITTPHSSFIMKIMDLKARPKKLKYLREAETIVVKLPLINFKLLCQLRNMSNAMPRASNQQSCTVLAVF